MSQVVIVEVWKVIPYARTDFDDATSFWLHMDTEEFTKKLSGSLLTSSAFSGYYPGPLERGALK